MTTVQVQPQMKGSMDVDIETKIQEDREKGRKEWDHPISFVLAAVGSAVGLGNVWRFPNLVSQWVTFTMTTYFSNIYHDSSLKAHIELLVL